MLSATTHSTKKLFFSFFLLGYITYRCLLTFYFIPGGNTLYYLDWSRHLDWGYWDGPPMISFCLRLFTTLFGFNSFSINSFNLLTTLLSSYLLYRLTEEIFDKFAAKIAASFFLVICFINFIDDSYHLLDFLFTTSTLLFLTRYMRCKEVKYLYFSAISFTLLFLSTYSSLIFVIAIMTHLLLFKDQGALFKNKHTILSFLLILCLILPNVIWVMSNNILLGQFLPKLHSHTGLKAITGYLFKFLRHFNYLILSTIYVFKNRKKIAVFSHNQEALYLLFGMTFYYTMFWGAGSIFFSIPIASFNSLFIPFLTLSAGGLILYRSKFHFKLLFSVYLIAGIVFTLSHATIGQDYISSNYKTRRLGQLSVIHHINKLISKLPDLPIVTDNYGTASTLSFWLENHPNIHTLNCNDESEHQYKKWSQQFNDSFNSKKIKTVIYVAQYNDAYDTCPASKFKSCKSLGEFRDQVRMSKFNINRYALTVFLCVI